MIAADSTSRFPSVEGWTELGLRPILYERENADAEYRADIGHTKRVLERYFADDKFRELSVADPQAAREQYGLVRDPAEVAIMWDPTRPKCLTAMARDPELPLSLRRFCAFTLEKVGMRKRYRAEAAGQHATLRSWRARQVARSWGELGPQKAEQLVHAPWVAEFSKGCSVGCWFCGVDAPKLGDQALYSSENRQLWRECLQVLQELLGEESARWGFCYWATDPLDNPDYEHYLLDYQDILGFLPQTTTAQAQKHVERVRAILKMSDSMGGMIDRFSILTLKQWNEIHALFTPEEMCFVECVPQNKEALPAPKSTAGRAYAANKRRAAKGLEPLVESHATSTIACASGFLINLVDRSVKLITPCNASDRWPLGYWVLGQGVFHDGKSFRTLCLDLVDRHLSPLVRHEQTLAFRPDLKLQTTEEGLQLTSPYLVKTFPNPHGHLDQIARLVSRGDMTAADIACRLYDDCLIPLEETFNSLNQLFIHGVINEEPLPVGQGQWVAAPL